MLKALTFKKGMVEPGEIPSSRDAPIWVDVTALSKSDAAELQQKFSLHPLTIDDLSMVRARIKIEEFSQYLFCVFYSVHKNKVIKTIEIDFVLGKNFLITNHLEPVEFIDELFKNKEKLGKLLSKGVEFLFYHLVDQEISSFFPVLDHVDQEIDHIERMISKKISSEIMHKIMSVKKKIILIKRIAMIQREKISFLAKGDYSLLSKKVLPYFRDIYDNSIRIFETSDNYRESVSSLYEVYMSTLSNNTNDVMKVLSIIATTALPMTVISGIYGTNFKFLPGSSTIYGFWVMIAAMVGVIGAMVLYFRRRGWF